jgi:dienelactone hydrolase
LNSVVIRTALAVCVLLVLPAIGRPQAPPASKPSLKDQTRMPWQRGNTDYFRRWIVSDNLACDLATECIPSEATIVATEGGETRDRNGKVVKWRRTDSWGDSVGFGEQAREGQVAYAFRSFPREKAGAARISIASQNGVRVWLNGKPLLTRDGPRALTLDDDLIDVDLQAGDNTLLVKLAAQDDFAVRVLESGTQVKRRMEIAPDLIEMRPDGFTVRTDSSKLRAGAAEVTIDVQAPGGAVKFTRTAPRGETVVVDAKGWPDGPYDVRFVTKNHLGLHYVTYRPWYKGNALDKARELEKAAAAADATRPEGFTLRMLAEMVEDRLEVKLAEAKGNPWARIHSPLMEFDELMLERAGKVGRVRAGGFVRLAWLDHTDDTPQYCRAYLPWNFDAAKKWPALLHLHGYNPANPKYVDWWSADSRHSGYDTEFSGNRNLIYIEPHGRGNTRYYGFGGTDVKRCIAEAKRALGVDEDRVYLSGDSMGGWGVWNVATRNPELFAGISAVFGGADYHAEMTEEGLAKLTPLETFLQERDSSWAQAESLNNMPILVHHGDQDAAVNVDLSRWGVRMLQRWGYDVRYTEYPGKAHEVLSWNNPFMSAEFFLSRQRDAYPRHVRVRSAELRNASAYWVRIEQRARPLEFMLADAEVIDRNVIRLDTQNVLDVVLSPARLVDAAQPVKVVWNGVEHELKPSANGELRLTDAAYEPPALRKSRALPGSINDFFNTPFAVVVGTSSKDARMREASLRYGEQFAERWQDWQKYRPRYFLDTQITEADIAKYSLILLGGPEANRVTAKLASKVPLRIKGDVVTIGGKSFNAPDAGVQMIYPNPRNPERYVWIAASTSSAALGFSAPNFNQLVDWDFIIDDGYVPAAKEQLMRERTRVVSGMFDQNWRYDPAFVLAGDAKARASGRRLRLPSGASADAKLIESLVGDYQFTPGPRVTVLAKDGKLLLDVGNQQGELQLIEGLEFYNSTFQAWVTFVRDASGKVQGAKAYVQGEDNEAKKLD